MNGEGNRGFKLPTRDVSISKTATIELCLYFPACNIQGFIKPDLPKQPFSLTIAISICSFVFLQRIQLWYYADVITIVLDDAGVIMAGY